MSYSHYRGRNCERILHAIHIYCGLDYSEYVQIGDGTITYHRKPFATYTWRDDIKNEHGNDVPLLKFNGIHVENSERFKRDQFFLCPYLDDYSHRSSIRYVVQEVKKCMSLYEALAFQHARNKLDGRIEDVIFDYKDEVILKIKETITKASHGHFSSDHWQHVVMCAIYDI